MTKAHLENEIDTSHEDIRCKERKLYDMTIRLDSLYDIMVELEKNAKLRRHLVNRYVEAVVLLQRLICCNIFCISIYQIMSQSQNIYLILPI
ncbi:hypothetical protein EDD76_10861 [Kineothrix alysoides]|uniref:Uncharacterized protein n=1 Tax=Kineothrix alysoides TaxID=1469948 RepID=A0A4R1QU99_9FIRM|nr:hypothetical protein EDD76_10861 [Kineothrix alysoides]